MDDKDRLRLLESALGYLKQARGSLDSFEHFDRLDEQMTQLIDQTAKKKQQKQLTNAVKKVVLSTKSLNESIELSQQSVQREISLLTEKMNKRR